MRKKLKHRNIHGLCNSLDCGKFRNVFICFHKSDVACRCSAVFCKFFLADVLFASDSLYVFYDYLFKVHYINFDSFFIVKLLLKLIVLLYINFDSIVFYQFEGIMSFFSLTFLVFFLIFVILYHIAANLKNNALYIQNVLLLLSGFIFYAFADLRFMPFLLYSIAITYLAGRFCNTKFSFIIFLIADLTPLLALKYCPLLFNMHWIFPLGISFFTFQSISYIADRYTKKIAVPSNLFDTALFISFFPVISSGPIQRAGNLVPQFQNVRKFDYDNATDGMKLFAWGMFKKICIADKIAVYVNYVYANASDKFGLAVLLATLLYSFQIYCDFSGYSDMAIGIAKYLGFDVGKNFDHPYLSKSVGEFWRRWHISLSSWLRDYVYIPLGGSRVKDSRIYLNLMITFLVSGLWHGSTWNFVIWGLLHGFFQCAGRVAKPVFEKLKTPSFVKVAFTFTLVTFAWIFFRAENLKQAGIVLSKISQVPKNVCDFFAMKGQLGMKETLRNLFALDDNNFGGFFGMAKLIFVLGSFIFIEFFTKNQDGIVYLKKKNIVLRWTAYIFITLILVLGNSGVSSNFIYNQF